ncbi:hypothetical protein SAMN02910317_02860 [Ruminococcaceae bacterium FB2012]|nr:hypothetical protein SAMN02910317_02860 [Ruminococcaceae bacterium FB2012]
MLDLIEVIKASKGMPVKDLVSRLAGEIMSLPTIYGWHVDPSVSDPAQAVTYLKDAVGKAPAAIGANTFSYGGWADAFFMPKPCMLRYDGTVAYYLDPDDYTKKADGTSSDIANNSFEGNAMMEWPLIWYKFEQGEADGEGSFFCSDHQVDESYKCWCNIDAEGEIKPHFYTSIYNGTGTSCTRSLSGQLLDNGNGVQPTSAATENSRAAANNKGSAPIWSTELWCDRVLINALLVLIGKSLDTQAVFGSGLTDNADISLLRTGALDQAGLFAGDISGGSNFVKVFGMENWWGGLYHRPLGLIGGADNTFRCKLTYGTSDGSEAVGYNLTGSGYISSGAQPDGTSVDSEISAMAFGTFGMLPSGCTESQDFDTCYADTFRSSRRTYQPQQGGWNGGIGSVPEVYGSESEYYPIRVCIPDMIYLDPGESVSVSTTGQGIMVAVGVCDPATNIKSSDSGWQQQPYTVTTSACGSKLCLVFRNSTNTAISVSDVGSVILNRTEPSVSLIGGMVNRGKKDGAFSLLMTVSKDNAWTTARGLACKP